jgi:hypothetical protein
MRGWCAPSTPACAARYSPFADVTIARRYELARTALPGHRLLFHVSLRARALLDGESLNAKEWDFDAS